MPADAKVGERYPCVIDIHGGGFTAGDKSDPREQKICNTLAHLAAIGGSAGGYFASILLLTKDGDALDPEGLYQDASCEIQAAVDLYGPVDLAADPSTAQGTVVERFLTRVQSTWPKDRLELLSPAHHVRPGAPPILVIHGEKDPSVLISQSERFVALLKKAGATCYYFPIPDAGHSFDLESSGTDLRDTVAGQ